MYCHNLPQICSTQGQLEAHKPAEEKGIALQILGFPPANAQGIESFQVDFCLTFWGHEHVPNMLTWGGHDYSFLAELEVVHFSGRRLAND